MSLRSHLAKVWRSIAPRPDAESALDEELRSYVELLVDEKVRAGLDPADARRVVDSVLLRRLDRGVASPGRTQLTRA